MKLGPMWLKWYDDTTTMSKVITQSRPLFYDYDDRTSDRLMEEANGIETEDLERAEVPGLRLQSNVVWQGFSFSTSKQICNDEP